MALCRDRILIRLGVETSAASSSRKKKRFIGDNMHDFLKHPWQTRLARANMTRQHLKKYRALSQGLLDELYNINSWNDWKHENVAKLVRHVAQFMDEVPFKDVVESMEDHPMDRLAKHRLHSCLSKIARYRQSAVFLSRMAKKIPIMRLATVDLVHLDPVVYQRTLHDLGPSNLKTVLRAIPYGKGTLQINNLPSWVQKFQGRFSQSVDMALRESKIHAEVQVVAHYEGASSEVVRPRVIASSKDACYLCHTFIRLHGKYSMPKSHGRIYTGWRLPAAHHMEASEHKLHNYLNQGILKNVAKFARVNKKPPLTLPNESTLFPLNISASTILSCPDLPSQIRHDETIGQSLSKALGLENNAKTDEDQPYQHLDPWHSRSPLHRAKCSTVDTEDVVSLVPPCNEIAANKANDKLGEDLDKPKQQDDNKSRTTSPTPDNGTDSVSSIVTQAQRHDPPLPGPIQFRKGRFFHDNIEMFIEDSSSDTKLRWMTSAESAEVLRDNPGRIIDALSLETGTETSYLHNGSGNISYFAFGQQVIMIDTSHV